MTAVAEPYWRHWYEVVSTEELIQGDILRSLIAYRLPQDLPYHPDRPADSTELVFTRADWIILSASCDIARGDDIYVLLSHVLPADAGNLGANGPRDLEKKLEVLRRGNDFTKFLLAECPEIEPAFPMSFVHYRAQVQLPGRYVRSHCGTPRLRLKSPFREKFGVWAGANLSRVGIEDWANIPPISGRMFAGDILGVIEER